MLRSTCRGPAAVLACLCILAVPNRASSDEKAGQPAPEGAAVLFNGKDLSGWTTLDGRPAEWPIRDGYMEVGHGDIRTKATFGPDFKLHVEFWLPLMKDAKSQARANSGVYLQGRYEVQVLDSYHNQTYAKGECAALYGILGTSKNANKPPEQWQTYDITFHSPRVDENGKVTTPGRITVVFNGETVIDDGRFDHVTGGALDEKLGEPGPIRLQDHGCKVRYRNIWLKPLKDES
jgi:3-keto-disaccharide hydrolase